MTLEQIKTSVKEKLYATKEEYEELAKNAKRFRIPGESFWGVDLGDNKVLICNDVIEFMGGPRSVAGMVGYHDGQGNVDKKESIELFVKAGFEAVKYFHENK